MRIDVIELNFKVTTEEAETILNGLANLRYLESASLIDKLKKQGEDQLKEMEKNSRPV